MAGEDYVVAYSTMTTENPMTRTKKLFWISFSILIGNLVITSAAVPTTIISTRKTVKTTTMTTAATQTIKALTKWDSTEHIETTSSKKLIGECVGNYSVIKKDFEDYDVHSTVSGDLDNDGKIDILVRAFSSEIIYIMFNNGNGTFTIHSISLSKQHSAMSITIADVNRDDKLDILVLHSSDGIIIFLNHGNRTFIEHSTFLIGYKSSNVLPADVNNDDYPDIIIKHDRSDGGFSVWINDGNGIFSEPSSYFKIEGYSFQVTTADVNDDHNLDIIYVDNDKHKIVIHFNMGNGTYTSGFSVYTDKFPYSVAIVDINNDAKLDFIVAHDKPTNIVIMLNNGNGTFSRQKAYPTRYPEHQQRFPIQLVDVDNNKKLDIVIGRGRVPSIGIFFNTGDNEFSDEMIYSIDDVPRYINIYDMNNDNQLDIVIAHDHSIGILYMHCL